MNVSIYYHKLKNISHATQKNQATYTYAILHLIIIATRLLFTSINFISCYLLEEYILFNFLVNRDSIQLTTCFHLKRNSTVILREKFTNDQHCSSYKLSLSFYSWTLVCFSNSTDMCNILITGPK